MKKHIISWCALIMMFCIHAQGNAQENQENIAGKQLFLKHCAVCHPDGGNVINPRKTLGKNDLEKNNLNSIDALVRYMKDPGPGMPKLVHEDREITIEQAREIAAYTINTFK